MAIERRGHSPMADGVTTTAATFFASGRLRIEGTEVKFLPDAMMRSGAVPCSTHATRGVSMSNWSVAGPPRQWPMLGTRNKRANACVCAKSPFLAASCL